jgi:H+/Cl- antiporter ClcA
MRTLAASGDARVIRGIVGAAALLLGVYCLLAAATALYAAPGQPDPAELAARERYQWPGWIPVVFLAIVVIYAVTVAARRRHRARGHPRVPSTQDPPLMPPERGRNGDARSP